MPEDHGKRTKTFTSNSSEKKETNPASEGDNKKLNLTKDVKSGLMDFRYKNYVRAFLSQLNIYAQGNE